MLKIDKQREPDFYKEPDFLNYFNSEDLKIKIKGLRKYSENIIKALAKETNNRCTYCEQELGVTSNYSVDHFYPKSIYKDKVLNWDNLFLCCSVCNVSKSSHTPDEILNPAKDDVENLLKLDKNGVLVASNNIKAENTIEMFKLNRADLVSMRLYKIVRSNLKNEDESYDSILKFRHIQNNERTKRILINDVPSNCDLLDRKKDAKILSESIIEKKSDEPIVVGIFGEWGEGKSSFMNLIETDLESNDKIECIRFNASEYDDKESIWYSLLNSILKKYGGNCINRMKYCFQSICDNKQIITIMKKIPLIVVFLFAFYFIKSKVIDPHINFNDFENVIVYLVGIVSVIDYLLPKSIKVYINSFQNEFLNAINYPDYTKKLGDREFIKNQLEIIKKLLKDKKVVIFVDELDRCSEETINSFFKAIEVFLPIKGFIYVIGINPNVVYPAVGKKNNFLYSSDIDFVGLKKEGKKYIEKYITIPVSLSVPTSYNNFIKSIYEGTVSSAVSAEDIMQLEQENEETFQSDDVQIYAKLINKINIDINVSPRDIKRILGALEMKNKKLYWVTERELTSLVIMNYFYPNFLNFFNKEYFDKYQKFDVKDYFYSLVDTNQNLSFSSNEEIISSNKEEISEILNKIIVDMPINRYFEILKDILVLSNNI